MVRQALDGEWALREVGGTDWLPGRVPGGVHLDLLAAGRIADPFVGDQELRTQWVAERDWEYRRQFVPGDRLSGCERVDLVFDGLDTLAEISFNGRVLGTADNMFRPWRWDVTGLLLPGQNLVSVIFRSAVRRAAQLAAVRALDAPADQLPGAPYLRKAPCHFGWDWGPRLPNIGFWQGIRLEGWSVARLGDIAVSQQFGEGRARIAVDATVERDDGDDDATLDVTLRVEHPDCQVDLVAASLPGGASAAQLAIEISNPQLWWPNGLGEQPLYQVRIEVRRGDRLLDTRSFRVGLRTLELRRQPDRWGECFVFTVNGVPVFAKGSNWIPADAFPARVDPGQLDSLLGAAAAANHNMIRVWGGGYYETEAFYDACDRLGILVWQDFMFACSVYPLSDPVFLASVEAEVRHQVRRLRHRACLALWCGNNEMERGWASWGWDRAENADLKTAYLRFFGETLPAWVRAADPATPYWPSSPSSGQPLAEPIGAGRGDEHEWTVWHGLAPFTAYGRESFRFVSEFGFESLPGMATIEAFAPAAVDRTLGSPILDHHQRCPGGNARILYYLAQQFRLPRELSDLAYLSQVLQAEAVRVGVEHWRRERDLCGGALYWQLDDCWPVSSWSGIDWFGRWKALHYVSRRFFAPILLSCSVDDGQAVVSVTNDLAESWRGEVRWWLETLDGRALALGHGEVIAGPVATTRAAVVPIPGSTDRLRNTVLVAELLHGRSRWARTVTPFVPDKHLSLRRPLLQTAVMAAGETESGGILARIVLRSDFLARWVRLALEGADPTFSDNYFDLPAGRETTVDFELPAGWDIGRVRAALRVRSVGDIGYQ